MEFLICLWNVRSEISPCDLLALEASQEGKDEENAYTNTDANGNSGTGRKTAALVST